MRILHVIASLSPEGGGPGEAVRQFGRQLVARGHIVEVASLDQPEAPWLAEQPFPVYAFGPGRLSYGFAPRLMSWLNANAGAYDAVIVDGLWQFSSIAAWWALRRSATSYYVFPHGMLAPWFKRTYPLKHLKKWLYWPWAEYRVLKDARYVIFTCEEERRLAKQSFWLYRANEKIINLGIAAPAGDPKLQRESFLDRYPHLRGHRLLMFLGRLHVVKGCDLVIEAFAKVARDTPGLHLVMVGPDQNGLQANLQRLAERLGVAAQITWTGMLVGDLKWGAYYSTEAFVLPSHQENFGMAVVEALACGKPVLISNKVNIWREISEDGAGLVASDDIEGVTALLKQWLNLSLEEREAFSLRANQCFLRRFEIAAATEALITMLEEGNA